MLSVAGLRTHASRAGLVRALSSRSAIPRLLVIDGYNQEGRNNLKVAGMSTAGELYSKMFENLHDGMAAETEIVYPADKGFELPDLKKYDGVAWTGSSLTVYHDHDPDVAVQHKIFKHVMEAGLPQFGSCWALQLGAAAFGAKVERNPKGREFGIGRKVLLTESGETHPMFQGRSQRVFDVFASHDDEVKACSLTPQLSLLASNAFSTVQAVVASYKDTSFWSVQYHPEYNLHELARLTFARIPKLIRNGNFATEADAHRFIDDLEALHNDPSLSHIRWRLGVDEDILDPYQRTTEVRNWMKHVVHPHRAVHKPYIPAHHSMHAKASEETPKATKHTAHTAHTTAPQPTFAMCFDVDGVLLRGAEVVEQASGTLKQLQKRQIPFLLVTNGGGHLEADKAKDLSKKLDVHLLPNQIVLAHTPMRQLATRYANSNILVVGKRYEKLKKIMANYGFLNVTSTEDYHMREPLAYPDLEVETGDNEDAPQIGHVRAIEAVFCLIDPLYWGRDIQIVCDAIRDHKGDKLPVYSACADVEYATDHHHPRLGSGSFGLALQHICSTVLRDKFCVTQFGKPSTATFQFAEEQLQAMAKAHNKSIEAIYMVGDNMQTDIAGANKMGGKWRSVLTLTGLYRGGPHNAHRVVSHVGEALDFALAQHS